MKYCELCEEKKVEEGEEFCIDCLWNAGFIQETPAELDFNIEDNSDIVEPAPDIWGLEDNYYDEEQDDADEK